MDYELVFWIVSGIVAVVTLGLMMARANRDQYVGWVAEGEETKW